MKTYTSYQTDIPRIINNSLTDNLSWATEVINDTLRYLTTRYYFNERTYTVPGGTVAQQQFYNWPPQMKKLINVTVTIGNVLWQPKECTSKADWDRLNVIPNFYQDFPAYFFVYNGQIGIWPTPSSTGNTITFNYKTRIPDLIQADYTTGTASLPYTTTFTGSLASGATSATLSGSWTLTTGTYQITFSNGNTSQATFTNSSTAVTWTTALTSTATSSITVRASSGGDIVTGSGTSFTKAMVGSWFTVPFSQTNGDQQWYQIASFIDSTHLALDNPYTGGTLSGVTYTIGQAPILPEDYQDLPLYRMGIIYYTTRFPDPVRAESYQNLYNEGLARLDDEYGSKTTNVVLNEISDGQVNLNLFVQSVS